MRSKHIFSPKYQEMLSNPDNTGLGAELGNLCVEHSIPIGDIAYRFSVTRATVYNWISGRTAPRGPTLVRLKKFMQAAKERPIASFDEEMQ